MPEDKILLHKNAELSDVRFEPHRDGDVVLRDASTVRIRAMRPSDEVGLCGF